MVGVEMVAGLPALGAGSHVRPEQGACLMEYVSVLAGEVFSDRPDCVDRRLASLARAVNDVVGDSARPRLALLAPALIGTATPIPTIPARSSAAGRWWPRACSWLMAWPGIGFYAEDQQRREVMGLADALTAAGYGEPARDAELIGLLSEAVTAHRATHRLPPAATGTTPCPRDAPTVVTAAGPTPAR